VDQLELRCAPLIVNDLGAAVPVSIGTVGTAPPLGGNGGVAFAAINCPAGNIATGTVIRAGDGVDAAGLRCSPLD